MIGAGGLAFFSLGATTVEALIIMKTILTLIFTLVVVMVGFANAADYHVSGMDEYRKVSRSLNPGDSVILSSGIWENAELLFEGIGTEENPIILTVEEVGKTVLTGQSNLRMAGRHLVVKGLVFKDGFSPSGSVISFRKEEPKDDSDFSVFAIDSRLTQTVIDGFSKPDRYDSDYWVEVYGQRNRLDHNHFSWKRNAGALMVVRLDSPQSRKNQHVINNNYFGPRPILGSNGGETLRLGTSHYSLTESNTSVVNNFFDRCNGEVEIISNKSGGNRFEGNVFYESRGTLTLRHGNGNVVINNAFIGNGLPHTGGTRIINADQTVSDNLLFRLTGYRFGGGFVIMNGVPNSPINRYHTVKNARVTNNTFIEVDHILFGAGSDEERTAPPSDSEFSNNTLIGEKGSEPIKLLDRVDGIEFKSNKTNVAVPESIQDGFSDLGSAAADVWEKVGGHTETISSESPYLPIQKSKTGVAEYPKPEISSRGEKGRITEVSPGRDTLVEAVNNAKAGDTLQLKGGHYSNTKTVLLNKPLVIVGKGTDRTHITFQRKSLIEIRNGGNLSLAHLTISGKKAPDDRGNAVVRSQRAPMTHNFTLVMGDVVIEDLDVNKDFDVIQVSKSSFADSIEIKNAKFDTVSGAVLKMNAETDDYGRYGAEYVSIKNSTFDDILGGVAQLYRGGTDESTFGPHFTLSGSQVKNVGSKESGTASVYLHGVQVTNISGNSFSDSAPIVVEHTVGDPITSITDNVFANTPTIEVSEFHFGGDHTANLQDNRYQND